MYGLDYKIIRLSNPYGPYQNPNGVQGAVTTFVYRVLKGEPIDVYGDGSVIRDYIYIEDAINGIINIANSQCEVQTFNLGTGKGYSIKELITTIEQTLSKKAHVLYTGVRKVDVPVNILDIEKYRTYISNEPFLDLSDGIAKTAAFMKKHYLL